MDDWDGDSFQFSDLEENSDLDDHFDEVKESLKDGLRAQGQSASKGPNKHMNELKNIMGLESFKLKQQNRRERKRRAKERKREQKGGSDGQKIVQTLASKLKMKSKSAPELVHYQDPRKKRKQQEGDQSSSFVGKKRRREMIADDTKDEVTMKQARLDVFKFGVSGFGKSQKVDLETANLIRLGAKPPKNKCHSLTELKEMRKKEKLEEQQAKEMQRISGVRMARPNASAPTKVKKKGNNKAKSGSSGIQAKLGKFDGGMLRLGASDIAKIKGGKR